jgi:hypothetical protein
MSIVHIDPSSPSIGDDLEATRHRGELRDQRLDRRDIDLLGHQYCYSTENIGDVEVAGETGGEMELIRRDTDIKFGRELRIGHILSSDLSSRSKSYSIEIVSDDITSQESISIFAIHIDDCHLANSLFDTVFIEIFKKLELGLYIVIHRLVEIEMILSNIGQHRYIIAESVDSMVVESMR